MAVMPRKIKLADIEQSQVDLKIKTEIPNEPEPSEIKEPELVIKNIPTIMIENTPE